MQVLAPALGAPAPQGAWVNLEALSLDVIVGLLPHERVTRQRLTLELSLELPPASFWAAADRGALEASVNYAQVAALARFVAEEGRFRLLESLLGALARLLLAAPAHREGRTALRGVSLSASKPQVLGGNPAPGVSLRCAAGALPPPPPPRLRLLPAPPPPSVEEWQALTLYERRPPRPTLDLSAPARAASLVAVAPPAAPPTAPQSLLSAQLALEPPPLLTLEGVCALEEVQLARVLCPLGGTAGARVPPQAQLMALSGEWVALRRQPPQALWALGEEDGRYPPGQLCLLPPYEPVSGAQFEAAWCVGGGAALWLVSTL